MARVLIADNATPLAGAGVYTSGTIAVKDFKIISGFVGASAAGDLYLEYLAPNGSTWVIVKSMPLVTAIQFYEFAIGANMRARYVNGAIAQSTFNFAMFAEYL